MKAKIKWRMSIMLVISLVLSTVFSGSYAIVYAKDNVQNETEQENVNETTDNNILSTEPDIISSDSEMIEKNNKIVNEELALSDSVIYVAQQSVGLANGESAENALSFTDAMTQAQDGDSFILVGEVQLPKDWHSPAYNITISGENKDTSILRMAKGSTAKENTASITLESDLTLDNLMLEVEPSGSQYLLSMFVIVANTHRLVIGSGVQTNEDTSKYSGAIFGGGYYEDVIGNTYIENNGTLLVTKIYGGGVDSDVTGNTNVIVTGTCTQIFGGGLSVYKSQNPANVVGNTNITIQNAQLTSKPHIYGGGDGSNANAIVTGNVTINHDTVKDSGKNIYGAGIARKGDAYVGGNVNITVKNYDMSKNNTTIYGAGSGSFTNSKSAGVKGNVSITYENGNFGDIYGAGEEKANVDGTTEITLRNIDGTPNVYGGGKGNEDNKVVSQKAVTINLLNTRVRLHTQGKYAQVKGLVTVNLYGGGADRNIDSVGSDLYNRMATSGTKNEYDKSYKANVNVVEGINTITTIHDFDNVNITNGSLLEHVREYNGSATSTNGPREIFNNVQNVTIGTTGTLDLLGDNTILGNFNSAGNLTTMAGAKLIVEKTVSSSTGASYTSSNAQESYEQSYAFLQTKQDTTPVSQFASTDTAFFVDNRSVNLSNGIQREWYLNVHAYDVIFEENGGTEVADLNDVKYGTKITEPQTTKVGYQLIGWYKESALENLWDFNKDIVETDLTLYAQWNAIPVIDAKNQTLIVGDVFNPLKDVTAFDKEDGDLTGKIEILKNEVDTSKAGTYSATYKVTDSKGASTTKTIYVTVNPKIEELNHVPTINAKNKTLTVGDTFDSLKDVTAFDKEDGDLTRKIEILKNEVDTSKAGTYSATYKVTDSKGASTTKTIKVTVKEKVPVNPHKPEKPDTTDKAPKTGDQTNTGLFTVLLSMSALGIAVLTVLKKKKALEHK